MRYRIYHSSNHVKPQAPFISWLTIYCAYIMIVLVLVEFRMFSLFCVFMFFLCFP